nr:hypothetical protein Itr_chr10CG16220 [Ipomoea trifida]
MRSLCPHRTVTPGLNHSTIELISNSDTLEEILREVEGSKGGVERLRGGTNLFLRGEARVMFVLEEEWRVSIVSSEKRRVVVVLKTRGPKGIKGVEAK